MYVKNYFNFENRLELKEQNDNFSYLNITYNSMIINSLVLKISLVNHNGSNP